jgi:phosphoribosylglycinamide formyltransferase-1
VTAELDGGPIIVQRVVQIEAGDTPDSLAARILVEEHIAYPDAVRQILAGGWRVEGRRFVEAPPI